MPNSPRIELPRPAIIAALGALVLAVAFVATQSKTSTGTSVPEVSPTKTSASRSTSTTQATTTSTTTATPKPTKPALQPGQGLPTRVAQALDRHNVVVLFFYEPAGADDQATRAAVRAVRTAGPGVSLFSDTVSRISSYRRLVGTLGISQSPAMVVIDKQRHARLYEGFLDAGTIRQSVRDAL